MFLAWFDDNPKKSLMDKIDEAIGCYEERFETVPNLCLVNVKDNVAHPKLSVKVVKTVQPNNFWIGYGDVGPDASANAELKKGKGRCIKAVA